MTSIDSNVLLRVIITDDATQRKRALEILETRVFVAVTVLLETAWVLRSVYKLDRSKIAGALLGILDVPLVSVTDELALRWALGRYATSPADLADLVHLTQSATADRFATFDKKLAAQAGSDAPVRIETIP